MFYLIKFQFLSPCMAFRSIKSMRKIKKIQERTVRFILSDTKSDYNMLLSISGFETLHLKRIHMFALEVFKCSYDFNPSFMWSTFNIKNVPYDLRDNKILTLPNFKGISYGKKSFKYYGAHVWNHIPAETRLLGRPQPQMYPPVALNQYTWVNRTHKHFLYMLQGPMKILK